MKKIFQFRCTECSEVFEEFTEYKQDSNCPICFARAEKIISTPRISLEGITGSFPGAAMTWAKKHNMNHSKGE